RIPHLSTASSTVNSVLVPRKSRPGLQTGLFVAALVLAGIVVAMLMSTVSRSRPAPEHSSAPEPRDAVLPAPPSSAPRPAPDAPPRPPATAADPLRSARDYVRSNPADFAGQIDLYQRATESLKGPGLEEARRELEAVRKTARERFDSELAALDRKVKDLCSREEFDPAIEGIEEARRRINAPGWAAAINQRIGAVQRQADELFASLKAKALDTHRRGVRDEVKAIQDRVARWGFP